MLVQERLGTVPDRVAVFENLSSQAEEAALQEEQQCSGSRTPRGTVRGVLPCGLPYRLNRISEISERSHTTVDEPAFDDGEPMHGHGTVDITPRSMCNSVVSVDSDCTEYDCITDEVTMHGVEYSVASGDAAKKSMRVVVPALQLKHPARTMPSITEEASCFPSRGGRSDATPVDTPESAASTDDISAHVHTENTPSMHELLSARASVCSNPFIDEPSSSNKVEQSLHAHACTIVASVHTPRSDLVFGEDVPVSSEASRSLPTTQNPTPCMSLMDEADAEVARGVLHAQASGTLPPEQLLTPLVDTIACGGYKGDLHQLQAQSPLEHALCRSTENLHSGRYGILAIVSSS